MAVSKWKQQLLKNPASFRDVPFYIDSNELSFGPKTAIHEFPKRDKNYVEDMGKRTRQYSITGYFLGNNYLDVKNEFINVVDKYKGRGILVHPYYGQKNIIITSEVLISENTAEGGICKFSFTCMEEGLSDMPLVVPATAPGLLDAINAAIAEVTAAFEKLYSFVDAAQSVIDKGVATINNGVLAISNVKVAARKIKTFQNSVENIYNNLYSLILLPSDLAKTFSELLGSDTSFEAIAENLNLTEYDEETNPIEQLEAFNNMLAHFAVIQACQSVAYFTFTDYSQTVLLKDQIGKAIDVRMQKADSVLYDKLHALRGALILDIDTRAEGLPSVRTIEINAQAPSIVLAYQLYEDAAFAEDIVNRNKLQHPGFIQSNKPIEVISRV
jgi:prophage DNA circulation protein